MASLLTVLCTYTLGFVAGPWTCSSCNAQRCWLVRTRCCRCAEPHTDAPWRGKGKGRGNKGPLGRDPPAAPSNVPSPTARDGNAPSNDMIKAPKLLQSVMSAEDFSKYEKMVLKLRGRELFENVQKLNVLENKNRCISITSRNMSTIGRSSSAIGPHTGKRCWPLLAGVWRALAPLMKPWCPERDVPTAANLNLYRRRNSCLRWHCDARAGLIMVTSCHGWPMPGRVSSLYGSRPRTGAD